MAIEKLCRQCNAGFTIENDDLEFYKKISPTFAGKTFQIPPPTLCPDCRRRRRLVWRNMKVVYSRKCDFSSDKIVSPFAPNSKYKIYKNEIWWSDKWNALDYGQIFDPTRPFFEQIHELQLKVPNMHSYVSNNENSEFCNCSSQAKDCYLVQSGTFVENCYYSQCISRDKDIVDCMRTYKSENCYECVLVDRSFSCFYLTDSDQCSESYFLDHCTSCKNCFACANLKQKQYWVYNKQSTRAEFEKTRDEFLALKGDEKYKKIEEIRLYLKSFPKRYINALANEDSTGDYIYHCKNTKNSYVIGYCENIKHSFNLEYAKDSYDHDFWGEQTEKVLDSVEIGDSAYDIIFSRQCFGVRNLLYCIGMVNNSRDCLGCVNLKNAQYCIFNKQYTKEEYEKLAATIVQHMQKTGEWGEFFPMKMSYFGYNESTASEYYPLPKDEAEKIGATWQEEDFAIKYDGPFYEPEDIKKYISNEQKVSEALGAVLKCKATGRPYKLQAGEMAFYFKNKIQIPIYHPDFRHETRFKLLNPLHLWHRQCMCEEKKHGHEGRCKEEFETTYAPDRPEKVYCEKCYQKSVV